MLGYRFEGCDPKNKTLLLATVVYEGGIFEGEPDVTMTVDGPYPMTIDEIRDEMDDMEGSLHPDVLRHINELMEVSQSIFNLKSEIPENRVEELYDISKKYQEVFDLHKKIKKIQKAYRDILESIIEGSPLNEISQLDEFIKGYYDGPTTKLSIDDDCLMQIPSINENNYLKIESIRGWGHTLQSELAYVIVRYFFDSQSRKFLRKCEECRKFYVSKTLARSKYCTAKCRLAFHNRKRIESGEHARYKRERKNKEKATASYYG